MKAEKRQIIQLNTILCKLRLQDDKRNIIYEASGGRTEHTAELTSREIDMLIGELNRKQNSKPISEFLRGDHIRKSILSMSYQLGLISNDMANTDKIRLVNEYIAGHTKIGLKKPLNAYTVKELQNLHYQFEVFLKYHLSKIESYV